MLGVLLGLAFGGVQLYLLLLAVNSLGTGQLKVWPLAVQFLCPFGGLGLCAAVRREQLIPCAVAMSAVLIVGAVIRFVSARWKRKE